MAEFEVTNKTALEKNNICTNCNKQLNVKPIFCVERNQQIESICGRCVQIVDDIDKSKKYRQYVFEKFAEVLTFPCANKKFGCSVVLHCDDVVSHEEICTFQGTKCPLAQRRIFPNESCTWEGNVNDLDQHIQESHKDIILNPLQIDLSDCKENRVFFTNMGVQIITIIIKYETESTYYCLLMVNGTDIDSQCFRFQLELFDEHKGNSIIFRKSRLEPLAFILEHLNNLDKMLEVDLVKIAHMLKHTKCISGRFSIVRKPKKEIALITGGKDVAVLTVPPNKPKETKVVDDKVLQELECPVCNYHMIPPIFICKTGHSICSPCKGKVSSCPNCRDDFSGARNFTLENLTAIVNYPCRNREIGCAFVTTSDKIMSHQLTCELSANPCLLDCGWEGIKLNLYDHLRGEHPGYLCEINSLHIFDIKDILETFFYLQAHGELFRLSIKQQNNDTHPRKFNIQQIGFVEGDPKFRYQLQIIDHSTLGLNLSFTNICRPLTDLKVAHTNGLSISWSLLEPFIFEQRYFYYKILIIKI